MSQALLHLLVGVQHHPFVLVINQPNRQEHLQFTALGFAVETADQTRLEHVQLRFTHRALESEQQPVVEVGRIIEAVFIEDQRVGERANLQQMMPIGAVAG